jgi:hypothetical protein
MCPAAYCFARRVRRAVSAAVSFTAPMPGGQGCPGRRGDGRVTQGDAQAGAAGLLLLVAA